MAGICGVLAAAEMRIIGRCTKRCLVHGKATDQDGPRIPQRGHNRRVCGRDPACPGTDPRGPCLSGHGDIRLEPDHAPRKRPCLHDLGPVDRTRGGVILAGMQDSIEPGDPIEDRVTSAHGSCDDLACCRRAATRWAPASRWADITLDAHFGARASMASMISA